MLHAIQPSGAPILSMLALLQLTVFLAVVGAAPAPLPAPAPAPVQVVYTGEEGCACPTQLGYQLNVPSPSKPKKYEGGEYGYRIEKPVQTKAKISYSFDFTVEQPRTPPPPKTKPAKLYAKVDRVTVNKSGASTHIDPAITTMSYVHLPIFLPFRLSRPAKGELQLQQLRRQAKVRTPAVPSTAATVKCQCDSSSS